MKKQFPRGLAQPQNGFHFALDSLLLASFVDPVQGRVADLGCGCGVIGFGLLLRGFSCRVLGIDRQKDMLAAAAANRTGLGFADRYDLLAADIRGVQRALRAGYFDAVVSNPPFRQSGRGKGSPVAGRNNARFEEHGGIDDFVRAAAWLLRSRGRFYCVFLAERCDHLLAAMRKRGILPKKVLPVVVKKERTARFVLVMGTKDGGQGMQLLSPLVLYDENGSLHPAVLRFCPFLSCNA